MAIKFANNATTTLVSGITSSETSISVADSSAFPVLGAGDYTYVTFDDKAGTREVVRVTAISSNTFTVVRGQDGTSAASFSSGDQVELRLTAALLNDIAGSESIDDRVAQLLQAGSGITLSYDDVSNELTIDSDHIAYDATNSTGSSIAKGTPVYQTGSSGNTITIAPADADGSGTMPAIGMTSETIAAGSTGKVTFLGLVSGFDTSAFSEGATLYISATAGSLTETKPTAESALVQNFCKVVKSHASNGSVVVMGAGRSNDTPNLGDGKIFIGNGTDAYEQRTPVVGDISDLTATATELNYSDGVTSNIQTQLDSKAPLASPSFTGDVTISGSLTTEGADGGAFIGTWPNNSNFVAFGTANMTGTEYALITDGNNTYLGAGTGGTTFVRGPANDSSPQIYVNSTNVFVDNGPLVVSQSGSAQLRLDAETADKADWRILAQDGATYGTLKIQNYAGATWGDELTLQSNGVATFAGDVTVTGDLTVSGTTSVPGLTTTADINFGDNDKAVFGAGSDLQIYHDGNNSYINDAGTGDLIIYGANLRLGAAGTGEQFLRAYSNDRVDIYYDNSVKLATASTGINVTGNIAVTGTVDGRDLATDGTKLDGIESGATADQTASEILTAIKTVDGAGSGLDADLLDGQQGSYYTGYTDTAIANLVDSAPTTLDTLNELAAALGDDPNFATTVTNSIGTKVSKSGDTITSGTSIGLTINHDTFGQGLVIHRNDSANAASVVFKNNALQQGILFGNNSGAINWRPLSGTTNYEIWHEGNDGSGSGLDADTVDGIQASSFLRSDANDTFTGIITGNTLKLGGSEIASSAAKLQVNGFQRTGNILLHEGGNTPTANNKVLGNTSGNLEWDGNKVWHAGNDGTGSGLDADLLDGQEGSYYAAASSLNSYLPLTGGTLSGNLSIDKGTAGDATLTIRADTDNDDEGDHPSIRLKQDGDLVDWRIGIGEKDADTSGYANDLVFKHLGSSTLGLRFSPNNSSSPYTIWHAGNDGTGSGLDADTLDGQEGSYYAPLASPTFTGTVTIPTADINGGTIDGTTIGGTTPAAGTFTAVTVDNIVIDGDVINYGAGDVTQTFTANSLAFAGASSGYSFDSDLILAQDIVSSDDTSAFRISGGTSVGSGGNIVLFPDNHATAARDINFRDQTTSVLRYVADNNSGTWEFNSAGGVEIQTGNLGIGTTPSYPLHIVNSSASRGLFIDQNNNGIALFVDSESTTSRVLDVLADAQTSGDIARFYTNSSSFSGNGVNIVLEHASSTGTALQVKNDGTGTGIFIDQNGNGIGLRIDSEASSENALYITSANTAGPSAEINNNAALANTGNASVLFLRQLNASAAAPVVRLENDGAGIGIFAHNTDATSTNSVIQARQEGTGYGVFIDQNGNGDGLYIDSEATTEHAIYVRNDVATTGRAFYAYCNSASFSGSGLIRSQVHNASATGNAFYAYNNGAGSAVFIDNNGSGNALSTDGGDVEVNEGNLSVYQGTGTSQFKFGASSNYYWDISRDNDVTGALIISNKNAGSVTERMRIDSSGNVEIDTGDLAVNGGALTVGNGTYNIAISTDQTGASSSVSHSATNNEGIFWHTGTSGYAIYRTAGTWTSPDYDQLKLDWPTGIELDGGGQSYGKSGVNILNGNLQIDGTAIVDVNRNLINIGDVTATNLYPPTDNSGVVGSSSLTWNNGRFKYLTIDTTLTVRSYIDLADSDGIRFGSSDDSRFWYNGSTNNFIVEMESACVGYQWTDNQTERMYLEKSTGNLSITGQYIEDYNATGTSGAVTINLDTGNNFSTAMAGAVTYTFSNAAGNGTVSSFTLKVVNNGSAITWPSSVDWPSGTAPTLSASGATDVFVFFTHDGGSTWYGFTAGQGMA